MNMMISYQELVRTFPKGKGLKDKAWIFFIGEQNAENPEIFYVSDYRLICAIVGHITYP
ncbi:Uncharacterised protein [Klebsiella pneumoniae]|nr:Uncharacterised protein [Klebsiella pneumoniae]